MTARTASKRNVEYTALQKEIEELKGKLEAATRAPDATPGQAPTKPLHMVIFNNHTSIVGWPSTKRDHPGFAIDVRGFIVPNQEDQEELATNWHFQAMKEADKLTVKYLERIPKQGSDEPEGWDKLNSAMKNDVLEMVYGDDFNFNHKSQVMPVSVGGQMDFPWIEVYYRPMLQMARKYLRKASPPKAEARIAAIDAHLIKLKNVNL